jgi:hypothetical protein|tara:strand:- start:68 stop:346 length:279 start_codon:yes stop_codon:yes gene_type:complete
MSCNQVLQFVTGEAFVSFVVQFGQILEGIRGVRRLTVSFDHSSVVGHCVEVAGQIILLGLIVLRGLHGEGKRLCRRVIAFIHFMAQAGEEWH